MISSITLTLSAKQTSVAEDAYFVDGGESVVGQHQPVDGALDARELGLVDQAHVRSGRRERRRSGGARGTRRFRERSGSNPTRSSRSDSDVAQAPVDRLDLDCAEHAVEAVLVGSPGASAIEARPRQGYVLSPGRIASCPSSPVSAKSTRPSDTTPQSSAGSWRRPPTRLVLDVLVARSPARQLPEVPPGSAAVTTLRIGVQSPESRIEHN